MTWILVTGAAWLLIGTIAALLVGRCIRLEDQRSQDPAEPQTAGRPSDPVTDHLLTAFPEPSAAGREESVHLATPRAPAPRRTTDRDEAPRGRGTS